MARFKTGMRQDRRWVCAVSAACGLVLAIATAPAAAQELAKLVASDGMHDDYFGREVDMSGTTILVGAPRDDNGDGAVYVYEQRGGPSQWVETTKLVLDASFVGRGRFGQAIDIEGDLAAITSEYGAYIYHRNASDPNSWNYATELIAPGASGVHSGFGDAVALKGDRAIVGDRSAGSAVVFDRNHGGTDQWGMVQTLMPSDGFSGFGYSVAIDRDVAVIGAPYHDGAGDNAGAAYAFQFDGTWQETQMLLGTDTGAGDRFGASVAVDGNTVASAAEDDRVPVSVGGAVYVYERDGVVQPWLQTAEIHQDNAQPYDTMGTGLALEGDIIVAGAPGVDDRGAISGAVFVFGRDVGGQDNWGQIARLTASDGGEEDRLGTQLGLSGELIAAGAYYHPNYSERGAVYVFPVPEPATLALLAVGAVALMGRRSRVRRGGKKHAFS